MMKIPIKYIVELGLMRRRNDCAQCGKDIDIKDHHIQLCKSCRNIYLDEYAKSLTQTSESPNNSHKGKDSLGSNCEESQAKDNRFSSSQRADADGVQGAHPSRREAESSELSSVDIKSKEETKSGVKE